MYDLDAVSSLQTTGAIVWPSHDDAVALHRDDPRILPQRGNEPQERLFGLHRPRFTVELNFHLPAQSPLLRGGA